MLPRRYLPVVTALTLAMSVSAHAATIQITMENLVFSPAEATAKVGDTIEWINKDILAHTATARNGEWDVMLPAKKTGTLILKKAGTVDYYCRFHPNRKTTIIIAPYRRRKNSTLPPFRGSGTAADEKWSLERAKGIEPSYAAWEA